MANTTEKEQKKKAQNVYDPSTDSSYRDALAALKQAEGNRPTYAATYEAQLGELYDKIAGRERFAYDPGDDPLWQNHLEGYAARGRLAMMDSMGQAAGLTGGYGSTYGQQVGQQTYQGYLQEADQALPEFYGMALDAYNREGDALADRYGMLGEMQAAEYARYLDAMDQYWQEVDTLRDAADTAYDRGYAAFTAEQKLAYDRRQDAYEKLTRLIPLGYSPTNEELEAAGMTRAQANALLGDATQTKTSSGSNGASKSKSKKTATPKQQTAKTTQPAKSTQPEIPIQGITNRDTQTTGYAQVRKTCQELAAGGAKKSKISQTIRAAEAAGKINARQAKGLLNSYI